MILSISGVVLLGIIVFLFFRKDGLKASHALVSALFGFYLASTAIAPSIKAGGESLASLLGGIKFFVAGGVIALAVAYLVTMGLQGTTVYFLTVSELQAKGASAQNQVFRVSGNLVPGTLARVST